MEDFFKRHIIPNRKIHIIRYYPKISTYEFVNVGIVLYDKDEIFYRLLQIDEIKKLHSS